MTAPRERGTTTSGGILELAVHGFSRDSEEVAYGKRWTCELHAGPS